MIRRRKLLLCSVLLLVFFRISGLAQSINETLAPPKHAGLPPPFSRFSAHDVLKHIFDSYDPASGRVANILNSAQKPTLVQIDEAKLWRTDGREYLAVLVELAADDYQFSEGGLCGNCSAYVILAVLKNEAGRLSLVAKQTPPASSVVDDSVTPFNPYEPSMIGGHSSLSLDLAPYSLSKREVLVSVRDELTVMGSDTVSLALYRIDGPRLREVLRVSLVDKRSTGDGPIRKTISTLSPLPRISGFYDYAINKTIIICADRNDDLDCDLKRDRIKQLRRQKELWRFNGEKFKLKRRRVGGGN